MARTARAVTKTASPIIIGIFAFLQRIGRISPDGFQRPNFYILLKEMAVKEGRI